MASKVLPILGGVMLFFFFPLIVVIALILGGMSSMDAIAATCDSPGSSSSASFAWPTDKHDIEQGWADPDPDTGASHSGLDFDVKAGSPVYAAADGEVVSIADNEIRIRHDKGVETRYKYFETFKVQVHDKVTRGQQIGTSGSGNEASPGESGDHLHFEMWIDKEENGDFENTKPEDVDNLFGDAADSGGGCGCGGDLSGNNNVQKVFNFFVSNGYSKEQAAGVIGNMQTESYVEPTMKQGDSPGQVTHTAAVANSSGGWGLVQWTPASNFIEKARSSGADDATIESLEFQLGFLKTQLEGKGPMPKGDAGSALKAAKTVAEATYAFGHKFEIFAGHETEGTDNWRKRIADAQSAFDQYAGSATGQGGGGGCGAGNGDIVKTALSLAWDTSGHGHDPKPINPTYADAVAKYNKSKGEDELTDCGVFVATVMVMSGVDPDYQRRGTGSQRDYVRSSPKYQVFEDLTNEGQLKPGDIFVHNGHTFIYTGPYKGSNGQTYNAASASLYGHVPEASHVYFSDSRGHYTVARIKK